MHTVCYQVFLLQFSAWLSLKVSLELIPSFRLYFIPKFEFPWLTVFLISYARVSQLRGVRIDLLFRYVQRRRLSVSGVRVRKGSEYAHAPQRDAVGGVCVAPRAPAHAPQRESHGNTVSRACAHEAREKGERKKRVSPGHGESRIYINILIFARTSTHTSPTEAGRGDTDIGREPGIDTVGCPYQRPQKERART
jgi:hypothetical protein